MLELYLDDFITGIIILVPLSSSDKLFYSVIVCSHVISVKGYRLHDS